MTTPALADPLVRVYVSGQPTPQGSMRPVTAGGRLRAVHPANVVEYRGRLTAAIRQAYTGEPYSDPVLVEITIRVLRPKSHYRTGRNSRILRDDAPAFPCTRRSGDVDKFARVCLDATTDAGLWRDDAQVASLSVRKVWGRAAGLALLVEVHP